jgi:hypothetical protein
MEWGGQKRTLRQGGGVKRERVKTDGISSKLQGCGRWKRSDGEGG